jgi:ppGpp synthetase/RelA/SpoT-type nucleotidyltranferase
MSSPSMTTDLTDPAAAARLSDEAWVALHVPRYQAMEHHYQEYATYLEPILKEICHKLAPLAMVSARPKGIPSFAEKILRKRKQYQDPNDPQRPDPLVRLTDLCGGRIIAQTADQVSAICGFIETHFDIDWPNSEDVSQRLKPTEFGYRSVHYIIQIDPAKLAAAGILLQPPAGILGPVCPDVPEPVRLKAEVQVRTLLEHASADIAHDLIYKTDVKVPARICREFARISATLEATDQDFKRLLAKLLQFRTNYGAHHERAAVEKEIALLRTVLVACPDTLNLAVKVAQLALSIGRHDVAESALRPHTTKGHPGVERVLGLALTEANWDQPHSSGFLEGRQFLQAACNHPEQNAETLCALVSVISTPSGGGVTSGATVVESGRSVQSMAA